MNTTEVKRPAYADPEFPILVERGASGVRPSGWHEDLEIKINRSDKLYITLEAEVLCGNRDEIFFIHPYQIHTAPNIAGINKDYDCIMISPDFFSVCGIHSISLRKLLLEDHTRFNNHIRNPLLTEILDRIIDGYADHRDPLARLRIQGLLLEFFSVMLRDEVCTAKHAPSKETDVPANSGHYHTIAPAIEAIHRSYDRKITSEELAQMCQLTHSYFCRLFKKVMGVTPIEYQTQNRLRLADVFLAEGTHTVADISRMVGFDDAAYFSRCYKKYRGVPPRRAKEQ